MSDDESREKTGEWLHLVLQTFYTYLERKRRKRGISSLSSSGNSGSDKGTSMTTSNSSDGATDLVEVNLVFFDVGDAFSGEGRLATLSDLVAITVDFTLNGSDERKNKNWIVKIPPNDKTDRDMAQMAGVDRREIHFYTEALPELEDWNRSQNAGLIVGVPRCYYARYHNTEPLVVNGDSPPLSSAESALVLEDMRPKGYSMRDCHKGLSLDEAFAALKEIATIHALSWAMQETTDQALDDKWEFAYRPQKAASAYKIMIEQGFPTLAEFLKTQQPDGPEILTKLNALYPRAAELLCELLEPPPPPAPSCLTHMDFWCNNLLFRKRTPPDGTGAGQENGNVWNGNGHTSSSEQDLSGPSNGTECLIIDWQMMAISRPTHDVALLLITSLTPEVRQQNTNALLKYYWSVFQKTASKLKVEIPFDYGVIEFEFKKSMLLALLLVVGSIDMALDSPSTRTRLMQVLRDMANEDLI